jgi:hypothetical protein
VTAGSSNAAIPLQFDHAELFGASMSRLYFFATGADLLLVLRQLESKFDIKYVEENRLRGTVPDIWNTIDNLPSLGMATGDQEIACDSYLVMSADAKVSVHSSVMVDDEMRYDVHQLSNPDSVLLRLGGFWKDGSLISGHFITSSEQEFPRKLINFLRTRVKKSFVRVQAFWVGPEALVRLRNGMRLCTAIQSPPEYDLRETDTPLG